MPPASMIVCFAASRMRSGVVDGYVKTTLLKGTLTASAREAMVRVARRIGDFMIVGLGGLYKCLLVV